MHDTTVKPVDPVDIELRGILHQIDPVQVEPYDTSTPLPTSYDNTASSNNFGPVNRLYNRKVWRYAKAHNISAEDAFKRLYK